MHMTRTWLPSFKAALVLGCAVLAFLGKQAAAEDAKVPLKSLIDQLRSADLAQIKKVEQELIGLPAARTLELMRAFQSERDLKAARHLAHVLTQRGVLFAAVTDLPQAIQPEVRRLAAAYLGASDEPALRQAREELAAWGHAGAPYLLTALNNRGQPLPRRRAAAALADMAHAPAFSVLVESLEDDAAYSEVRRELLAHPVGAAEALIRDGMGARSERIRRRAAELLGWLNPQHSGALAVPALLKGLSDRQPAVVLACQIALANLADEALFETLLKQIQQAPPADRLQAHAAAVGLARAAGAAHWPLVEALTVSRNVKHREVAALSLGLWKHPAQEAVVVQTLVKLLSDGASTVQQRAAESLGALANRRFASALQAEEPLWQAFSRGRPLVRYAAALALGEIAAKGRVLPDARRTQVMRELNHGRIEDASGACREALLCVVDQVSGTIAPARPAVEPPKDAEDTKSAEPKKEEPQKEEPKEQPTDPPPATEPPPSTEPPPAGESPPSSEPPAETPQDPPPASDPGLAPAPEAPKDPPPSSSDPAPPPDQASSGKTQPGTLLPKVGVEGMGDRSKSPISSGPPSFGRQRLEEIENPARPGQVVFSNYVQVR
ncbi:MAG: HEAT repeat domain-containing protein [Planctomycetes bacterium]|nr:HEAT repeat domain-containing protein [Planctomycetota bacterium]